MRKVKRLKNRLFLFTAPTLAAVLAGGCGGDAGVSNGPASAYYANVSGSLISDATLSGYVSQIGGRLMKGAREKDRSHAPKVTFEIVAVPGVINCTTIGGEHVYITADLIQFCRSEEELAAAISHAYAHVVLKHKHELKTADLPPMEMALELSKQPFSPAEERAADRLAYELFARAGWDPSRFGDLFSHLTEAGFDSGGTLRQRVQAAQFNLPSSASDWEEINVADDTRFGALKNQAAQRARSGNAATQQLLAVLPNCLTSVEQPAQRDARKAIETALAQQPPGGGTRDRRVPINNVHPDAGNNGGFGNDRR